MVSPLDRTPRICTALGTPGPCLGQSSSKQTSQIHRLHLLLLLLLSRFSRVNSVRPQSPPGSPVPGILQARTLEWVAIYVIPISWVQSNQFKEHTKGFRLRDYIASILLLNQSVYLKPSATGTLWNWAIIAFPTGLLFDCPPWAESWPLKGGCFSVLVTITLCVSSCNWSSLVLSSNLPRSPKLWAWKFSPAQGRKHPAGYLWASRIIISLLSTFLNASPSPALALLLILNSWLSISLLNSWLSISLPRFTFFLKNKKPVSFFLPISSYMVSVPTLPFELRGSLKLPLFHDSSIISLQRSR